MVKTFRLFNIYYITNNVDVLMYAFWGVNLKIVISKYNFALFITK